MTESTAKLNTAMTVMTIGHRCDGIRASPEACAAVLSRSRPIVGRDLRWPRSAETRVSVDVNERYATRGFARVVVAAAALALVGCATRLPDVRLEHVDPAAGYRLDTRLPQLLHNDPETLLLLAFSGSGTRAAAFSYGVLEELRRTPVTIEGRPTSLLGEVDVISSVSGGSFTALAYALYGEQLFDIYESRS